MVAQIPERKELIHIIVDSLATPPEPKSKKKRIFGLHAGMGWISDDFDDELPDSFWLINRQSDLDSRSRISLTSDSRPIKRVDWAGSWLINIETVS